MSLTFPTHAYRPARPRDFVQAATERKPNILSRLRWPLILALGLNLVLWVGLAAGVRALVVSLI